MTPSEYESRAQVLRDAIARGEANGMVPKTVESLRIQLLHLTKAYLGSNFDRRRIERARRHLRYKRPPVWVNRQNKPIDKH